MRALHITLWVLLCICVLWTWARFLPVGVDWHRPLPEIIALIQLLWIPVGIIGIVGIVFHWKWLVCVAIAVLIWLFLLHKDFWFSHPRAITSNGSTTNTSATSDKSHVSDNPTAAATSTLSNATNIDTIGTSGSHTPDLAADPPRPLSATDKHPASATDESDISTSTSDTPHTSSSAIAKSNAASNADIPHIDSPLPDSPEKKPPYVNTQQTNADGSTPRQVNISDITNPPSFARSDKDPANTCKKIELRSSASSTALLNTHHLRRTNTGSPSDDVLKFRVMTLNCRYGRANVQEITTAVRENHIDVLALQEVTESMLYSLEDPHFTQELPWKCVGSASDNDNGGVNALFTRMKPIFSSDKTIDIKAAQVPLVIMDYSGQEIAIASAHPKSPQRSGAHWGYGISNLFKIVHHIEKVESHEIPTIIMGDLNSSIHHPSFRNVLHNGLQDAALSYHKGIKATFPNSWPGFPRLLNLDHILFRGNIEIQNLDIASISGTDHAGLVGRLIIRP